MSLQAALLSRTQMRREAPSIGMSSLCALLAKQSDMIARLNSMRVPTTILMSHIRKSQQLIDNAAHEAATSPHNLHPQPTEAQASAGNYRKGHVTLAGLRIAIENPAGSRRRPEWPVLQAHYGYVKGSEGADGDHVDVFLRPATDVDWRGSVYVIDQHVDGKFDEHKCMVGWDSEQAAVRAYLSNYQAGWQGVGGVTAMSLDAFKAWLKTDTTQPLIRKFDPVAMLKEFTQSSSATSGITAYGNTGKKKKATARRALYSRLRTRVSLAKILKLKSADIDLFVERLFAALDAVAAQKIDLAAYLKKGDEPGHEFHGNQWTGGTGPKPTETKPGTHKEKLKELLTSGHAFSFEELLAATGAPKASLQSAMAYLKNDKYAGKAGPLNLVKVGGMYHLEPQAGEKPVAAEKPAATPKAAAAEKPANGIAKAPAVPMEKAAADKTYLTAVTDAGAVLQSQMKTLAVGPATDKAILAFKDAKALAMAQWAANTSGKDQTAKAQQLFGADKKLGDALAQGVLLNAALVNWKGDTAAEKMGALGVKPVASSTKAAASGGELPAMVASGMQFATHDELVTAAHVQVSAKDFTPGKENGGTTAKSRFENEISKLNSVLHSGSLTASGNKASVEAMMKDNLATAPNFQILKDAVAKSALGSHGSLESRLIGQWAGSSGDGNALSVALQLATRDAFQLPGSALENKALSTLAQHGEEGTYKQAMQSLGLKPSTNMETFKAGLKEFIGAQYKTTQSFLAAAGIKEVSVVRGMHSKALSSSGPAIVGLKLQPASSFSTSLSTAKSFGSGDQVYFARVPAAQVLGTFRTGFGCTNESEVVLLAHNKLQAIEIETSSVGGMPDAALQIKQGLGKK